MSTNITTASPFSILTSTITNTNIKILIIVFLVTMIGILKLKQRSTLRKVSKGFPLPPGPTPWPILGSIPDMLHFKPTFRWIHQMMKEMNIDIACIRFGNTNVIPVFCPEIAREMLKKQDANFADRPLSVSANAISGGYKTTVVVPYNEQWKKMRKILVSEITCPARHKWLHDKRAEESDNLVFYVHNQYKNNKYVNIRIAAQHYCGNVIRKLMFNRRYFGEPVEDGGPGPDEIKHVEAIFTALKYVYSFCVSDYLPFLRGLDLDGQEKISKDANKTIRDYQNPIINERYGEWRSDQRKETNDLLDVLITLKDNDGKPLLTLDEIKNQSAEIMMAAIDNPSNAIEWAMAELINQPELLKKATKEIDMVVGKDRLVQESDIAKLNYVKACARESFRLHPIAPFNLPHVTMQDTIVAGYFIPKGSHAILSRYGLGRNPKTWKDPLKFNPERHMNGQDVMLTEHDLRFISFSTGRRGCIGALLGTCMTTMLLARLLQCFDWTPPGDATEIDLSEAEDELSLINPLIVSVKPRLDPHLYPTSN